MRKTVLSFLFFVVPIVVIAQTVYDRPAEAPIINTYVPMSHEEMVLRAAMNVYKEMKAQQDFNEYVDAAYEYLQKNQISAFIGYANAALNTGYYNDWLYYNLGISYYISGQKRKGKKFLKKALKEGSPWAEHALSAIKRKVKLSNAWFKY